MNPQQTINLIQGNFGYQLAFTLTDSTGAVINLTGATLTFEMQLANDPTVSTSGSMAIANAAAGDAYYAVQVTDFTVPGEYLCQINIDFTGAGELISIGNILVVVQASIPVSF